MSNLFLLLFYFARPITTMNVSTTILGLSFFEFVAVIFSLIITGILFLRVISQKHSGMSRIELALTLFIIWCLLISAIYYQDTNFKLMAKWILPPLTYLAVRRAVKNKPAFLPYLRVMIFGLGIAALGNSLFVALGNGLETENYWTGLLRYKGLYEGSHTMGHSMGFLLILIGIYISLSDPRAGLQKRGIGIMMMCFLTIFAAAALYGIYKSQVRTVYVGLFVFFSIWLFLYSKRIFFAFAALGCIGVIVMLPYFGKLFFDFIDASEGNDKQVLMAGSGRPNIWLHNLELFKASGFDRKLAGVGIGNIMTEMNAEGRFDTKNVKMVWNSHNDFLEVLMETGIIGFILITFVYLAIFRQIRSLPRIQRAAFLAFFFAIVVMNMSSNSYISRFPFAQMFFMTLAFIELRERNVRSRPTETIEEMRHA